MDKTSAHVALQFENTWLSRYPLPRSYTHDQGGEFVGYPFQRTLDRHGIRSCPTTAKNLQSNAIVERMHQAVGNTLRALLMLTPPHGIQQTNQLVDTTLANCFFVTRAAINSSLRVSPGSLAFGRDMILDIPLLADWNLLQQQRQQLIDDRLIVANRCRFSHDYHIGDEVLKLAYKPDKLTACAQGPYGIEQVHTNGTVTIRLNSNTLKRI